MVFEEKSDNHARYSKYRGVYALLISFLKQFNFFSSYRACAKESFDLPIFWLFLRKSKITAGDTLNSTLYMSLKRF